MSSTTKLALQILILTAIALALAVGIVSVVLIASAPKGRSPEIVLKLGDSSSVWSVAWSLDGKTLASANSDATVKLWEAGSGRLLSTLSSHRDIVYSVAWSPDPGILASAGSDATVKLWQAGSDRLLHTLIGHADSVFSLAWSPDGKILASASWDNTVKLWAAGSGHLLHTLSGHAGIVYSVAWSPDGQSLASASWDDTVKLWAAGNGRQLRTLSGHAGDVFSVAWSPDGQYLASAGRDDTVKLWAAGSGHLLHTLRGHAGIVYSVAWSPDGQSLASASWDDTVKLWEAGSGRLLGTLSGHTGDVNSVAWSPDGTTLSSGGEDATVRIWNSSGEKQRVISSLPGNDWLSYDPKTLIYSSSLNGDEFAAIRFDSQLRPLYPLAYYRDELKREELPSGDNSDSLSILKAIQPRPIRYAWDTMPDKGLWSIGSAVAYLTALTVTLVVARWFDPAQVSRRFFAKAGFQKAVSIKHNLLLLNPAQSGVPAYALVMKEGWRDLANGIAQNRKGDRKPFRTYLIYAAKPPQNEDVHALRRRLGCEVIPLLSASLERALSEGDCGPKLRELEEPYVTRIDPYDDARPIADPTWFYGRKDLLEDLPAVLSQGQPVGIFGLRKVGKTSLINQLRNRLLAVPTVWIDCQGFAPVATDLLAEVLRQAHSELLRLKVSRVPKLQPLRSSSEFRALFLALHRRWVRSGAIGPTILILDEVDKLFPDRRLKESQRILSQYQVFFRILRALFQEQKCVSILVAAYRPEVNRQNFLSPVLGENPMHMSFQEYYLGALDAGDSHDMVKEIGAWKEIHWTKEALQAVYEWCGGHPLITRMYASHACKQGKRKKIGLGRATEVAGEISSRFHRHRIGQYYAESLWAVLREDERRLLKTIAQSGQQGKEKKPLPQELEEALANLEQFGLVHEASDSWRIGARLFRDWILQRRAEA